jgi:CBS domain-containing protein
MQLSTILANKGDFVATIAPDAQVRDVIGALAEHRVGALVVSSDGSTVDGIVSERDVVMGMANGCALDESVASIMTTEVFCAGPDAHIDELMQVMTQRRFRHIPITDPDGILIGIVSIGDVVKTRLDELEAEKAALVDYVTRGG